MTFLKLHNKINALSCFTLFQSMVQNYEISKFLIQKKIFSIRNEIINGFLVENGLYGCTVNNIRN